MPLNTFLNGNRGGILPNELIVSMCETLKLALNNFGEDMKLVLQNRETVIVSYLTIWDKILL